MSHVFRRQIFTLKHMPQVTATIGAGDFCAHAVSIERRRELDLYKRYAGDPDFKRAFDASISRLLAMQSGNSNIFGA